MSSTVLYVGRISDIAIGIHPARIDATTDRGWFTRANSVGLQAESSTTKLQFLVSSPKLAWRNSTIESPSTNAVKWSGNGFEKGFGRIQFQNITVLGRVTITEGSMNFFYINPFTDQLEYHPPEKYFDLLVCTI